MTWSTHQVRFYHGPSGGLWSVRCTCGLLETGTQQQVENLAAIHDLIDLEPLELVEEQS